jgi:DinB superfamily
MNQPTYAALEAFPDQLRSLYEAFPLGSKHFAPASWEGVPSEPLTAIEQVYHVLDIELEGYQVRIQRTLDEWNPTLPSLDSEAMARERFYFQKEAAAVLRDFRNVRTRTIELLRTLTHEQLERPAQFEGYGQVTLRSLVHYLCSHDQQHLSGLQWLLGKLSSSSTENAA